MKQRVILLLKHINRFGLFDGLNIFFKNHFFKNSDSKIFIEGIKYPIYLRKKTSDIQAFDQVFLDLEYGYNLKISPKFIIDCGANIGLASVYFKNKFPDSTIVSIEPEETNYLTAIKNTQDYKDINLIKSGIWNKNTFLKVTDVWNFGNWGFVCNEIDNPGIDTVQAISVSEILKRSNRTEIDILKIDIEGSELELFSSNYEDWLPNTKVIMIELHDAYRKGCSKAFFNAILKYDFSIFQSGENIICIRNEG
jgi:FkbM family methyltransferase